MQFSDAIKKLTPDIYQALKTGVELGRWPNGQVLTNQQRSLSMEAVIRYEVEHQIPPEQRVGYIAPKKKPNQANQTNSEPVQVYSPTSNN